MLPVKLLCYDCKNKLKTISFDEQKQKYTWVSFVFDFFLENCVIN